jgi:hypothetical protein
MNLAVIKNKLTTKVSRQVLVGKKHSPTLLFGVGIIGVTSTVVLACRATLKMEEILSEAEENSKKIDAAKDLETENYTDEDAKQDVALNRTKTALKIVKLYAPSVVVGVISVGALTGSHIIFRRRNAALTAAYAAVDKGFKEYRQRVVGEYGKDKDQEFRFGVTEREIAVDTDEGVAVKTVRQLNIPEGQKSSVYAVLFSEETSRNWQPQPNYNAMFIQAQQAYANNRLNAEGFLFLNDVYESLGLPRTSAGQVVGWVKGNKRGGDNYIDFGVFSGDSYMGKQFVDGNEKSIWLDPNVDGVVYDLI